MPSGGNGLEDKAETEDWKGHKPKSGNGTTSVDEGAQKRCTRWT